jgi:dTDP-glucose 4,6-dehydratase
VTQLQPLWAILRAVNPTSFRSVLVTGGCGFIGSNLVRHLLGARPDLRVITLDKLTYAGNLENLAELEANPRHRFVRGDIGDHTLVPGLLAEERVDAVMNLAAESHVDRSILGPEIFAQSNVGGTAALLEDCRKAGVRRFLQVSTDEVYGSLGPEGLFTEGTPLDPTSPYSASKAAADLLALAYHRTFGFDVLVSRCSNNYGPYQFPEKLIPLMVVNALRGLPLPVYGDGKNVRDWIHVEDHCEALLAVLERGSAGQVYNIGADSERRNIDIVKQVVRLLGASEALIQYVTDRPGHDRRYAIDARKAREQLGWAPRHSFEQGLKESVDWYVANRPWWERVLSGGYRSYYEEQYAKRLTKGSAQ